MIVFTPAMGGGLHIALPVGLNVQLSDTTDWVFELRPMSPRPRCDQGDPTDDCERLLALRGTVGVAWTPGADENGSFKGSADDKHIVDLNLDILRFAF